MASDEEAKLLNEIGNVLAQDKDYPLEGTFMYVEAERMMVSIAIYKDLGDRLLYRWPMEDLDDVLLELWEAAPEDKHWAAMQYHIEGGRFEASFTYPEEINPDERSMDRRNRIVQQRYGNKRIDYPLL